MENYVKETILSILLMLISVCSFGQKGDKLTDKGYHGEISVSSIFDSNPSLHPVISTTHGYNFGNGFNLGAGLGIIDYDQPILLAYLDAGYYFDCNKWHPYGRATIGIVNGEHGDAITGVLFVPEIGVGKGRFTLGVGVAHELFIEADNIVRPQLSLSFHF